MEARLIIDAPAPGAWNMAVDEVLMGTASERAALTLRLYRWSAATVSLGHFQDQAKQQRDPRLASLPTVRRLSGGGAILHHHEQTYSCSLPPSHPLAQQPRSSPGVLDCGRQPRDLRGARFLKTPLELVEVGGALGASAWRARHEAIHGAKRCLGDRKSTRLNSSHIPLSRMPSSA